jgi:hypothetical protein
MGATEGAACIQDKQEHCALLHSSEARCTARILLYQGFPFHKHAATSFLHTANTVYGLRISLN